MLLLLTLASPALANSQWQDVTAIQAGAAEFARQQTLSLPGRVSISASPLEPRLHLPACAAIEYFLPTGGRLWGNGSVGARCADPTPWTVYVPVNVKVTAEIVFAARPITTGQKLAEADILLKSDDLTQYAAGVMTDPRLALGKTATIGVPAGYPLRADMLRAPYAVQQGQAVKLIAQGRGFQVNSDGKALNNAVAGQTVSVRVNSGQVIKGTAREGGMVEVQF